MCMNSYFLTIQRKAFIYYLPNKFYKTAFFFGKTQLREYSCENAVFYIEKIKVWVDSCGR